MASSNQPPRYCTHVPLPFDSGGNPFDNDSPPVRIVIVNKASQLPLDFLTPSPARQLLLGIDCKLVHVGRHAILCVMQLAFQDAIYLVDAVEGEQGLINACKPALESSDVKKVIHDCKRISEALYFQFGIKLHNVMDPQIAYSLIENQEGRITRPPDDDISFVGLLRDSRYCGISHKEQRPVRRLVRKYPNIWNDRPLPEHLIQAAADDVRFLLYIYYKMIEIMNEQSLWYLAVRGALYCQCFCLSNNNYDDWPPLPPIPDALLVEGNAPEEEILAVLDLPPGKMGRAIRRGSAIKEIKQSCCAEIHFGDDLGPPDKVFVMGPVNEVRKAQTKLERIMTDHHTENTNIKGRNVSEIFSLWISGNMENATNLRPQNGVGYPYMIKFRCTKCSELTPRESGVFLEAQPKQFRNTSVHLVQKCKFCSRLGGVKMLPERKQPLSLERSKKRFVPLMSFECFGFEPVYFVFAGCWEAESTVDGKTVRDISFTNDKYEELDIGRGQHVRIDGLKAVFLKENDKLNGGNPFDNDAPMIPIHKVTVASELPVEFIHPSPKRQLVVGLDLERANLCRHGPVSIMQLAFQDAIYLVDAVEGGQALINACKPALESSDVKKVIHDCKRVSEALYFQFGIKLHNVMDPQIAYSLIEEQEGRTRAPSISFVDLLIDPRYCGFCTAAGDVQFLLYIYQKMIEKLNERSLWYLAVRGALYCRCFCLNDNGYADWPSLPPIPDGLLEEGNPPEEEILLILDVAEGKMEHVIGRGETYIMAIKQSCSAEIHFGGDLGPPDKVFIMGPVTEVRKAEAMLSERIF